MQLFRRLLPRMEEMFSTKQFLANSLSLLMNGAYPTCHSKPSQWGHGLQRLQVLCIYKCWCHYIHMQSLDALLSLETRLFLWLQNKDRLDMLLFGSICSDVGTLENIAGPHCLDDIISGESMTSSSCGMLSKYGKNPLVKVCQISLVKKACTLPQIPQLDDNTSKYRHNW